MDEKELVGMSVIDQKKRLEAIEKFASRVFD